MAAPEPRIRPPAVAGSFYPAAPAVLRATVEELLAAAAGETPVPAGPPPKAVIAPHAGYVYSGPVAAVAFRALAARRAPPRKIVLIGPSHRVPVRGLALPGVEL